ERRTRIDLIGAIAHPHDARFIAGTRTAVASAVGVDQDYSFAGSSELVSRPRAEHSGADHGHVVGAVVHRSLKCLRGTPLRHGWPCRVLQSLRLHRLSLW